MMNIQSNINILCDVLNSDKSHQKTIKHTTYVIMILKIITMKNVVIICI
jgi:hypothetical protein